MKDQIMATGTIRDRIGNRIGHYDKGTGTTRDKYGNRLAQGNILASLIMDARKRG